MAHETGQMVDDPAWTRENATPLIGEVARFFRSFCRRETDGRWHFFLTPSLGQDEAGGSDQKNFLCILYGAKYAFQTAIAHGLDADGAYGRILAEGLAFDSLLSEQGFYHSSAGAGAADFGRQKHPVQLNGLAYLPVESAPLAAERTAHALRYATTNRAADPHFLAGRSANSFSPVPISATRMAGSKIGPTSTRRITPIPPASSSTRRAAPRASRSTWPRTASLPRASRTMS